MSSLGFPRVLTRSELQRTGIVLPRLSILERAYVYGGSLAVIGAFYWAPIAVVAVSAYLVWKWRVLTRRQKLIALAVLVALFAVPRVSAAWVRRLWFWKAWLKYMAVHIVFDDSTAAGQAAAHTALHGAGPTLVCISPHGVFPFGLALALVRGCARVLGPLRPVVADITMHVPFISHLIAAMGGVTASAEEMSGALAQGEKLIVAPGGVGEIFLNRAIDDAPHAPERILLQSRKGLVRLALQYGASLVPIYVFGASEHFHLLPASQSRLVQVLSRMLRASLILFYGKCGLPIPLRRPLLYVVGQVIDTSRFGADTSASTVDEVHRQLVSAMQTLFDSYKGLYSPAYEQRQLVIE